MTSPASPTALARALERYRPIVDDWPAFLDALSTPTPACAWANPARIAPADLEALLADEGLAPRPLGWRPGGFRLAADGFGSRWWYLAGLAHAQEEASMLPVRLLDPQPGERVLDLCAAPGGKTAEISLAVGPAGTVVANDARATRLRALRSTVDRLGLANVTLTRADGCQFPPEAGFFDRVLVDAPCSDEGMLRRQPRLAGGLSVAVCRDRAARQKGLLRRALSLCRPGGRVVYSTCTFAPEENEEVIDAVLRDRRHELRLVAVDPPGLVTGPGIDSWEGRRFDPAVRGAVRIWPHHNDTGGFFAAVLEKAPGPADRVDPPRHLEPAPAAEWRPYAGDRHGIPEAIWDAYLVHRRTTRGLHVTNRAQRPPGKPELHSVGLLLVKDRIRYPKLTTAGALLVGGHATRNVVDLEVEQVEAFHRRQTIPLRPGQADRCGDVGYVVIRHRGFPLGTAFHAAGSGTIRSLFPRRWLPGRADPR